MCIIAGPSLKQKTIIALYFKERPTPKHVERLLQQCVHRHIYEEIYIYKELASERATPASRPTIKLFQPFMVTSIAIVKMTTKVFIWTLLMFIGIEYVCLMFSLLR